MPQPFLGRSSKNVFWTFFPLLSYIKLFNGCLLFLELKLKVSIPRPPRPLPPGAGSLEPRGQGVGRRSRRLGWCCPEPRAGTRSWVGAAQGPEPRRPRAHTCPHTLPSSSSCSEPRHPPRSTEKGCQLCLPLLLREAPGQWLSEDPEKAARGPSPPALWTLCLHQD